MTFRSAILDKRVKISSWIPSAKYALALSSLKFSNGITAMLFSGIAAAAGIGVAGGVDGAPLPVATGAEGRDKRTAAIISAAIRATATAIIQLLHFFSRTTGDAPLRACRNLCATFGFPVSSPDTLT